MSANEQSAVDPAENPRLAYLDRIGKKLDTRLKEAIIWRSDFDERFIDAELQYSEAEVSIKEARQKQGPARVRDTHQSAPDNITRSATIVIASRVKDMLFPTNGRNWDIETSKRGNATPVASGDPQMAAQEAQQVAAMQAAADMASGKMEQLCADALDACQYAKHGRDAIFDGHKYGTGVLFGPFPKRTVSVQTVLAPQGGAVAVQQAEGPAFERWDPWDFYPQPCRHIKEAEYAFGLNMLTKRQVNALSRQPGFDAEQIARLLETHKEPSLGSLADRPLFARGGKDGKDYATMKGRYPVWRFIGSIDRECLEHMMPEGAANDSGEPQGLEQYYGIGSEGDDPADSYMAEVWMSHGIVIKAVPLPTQELAERLPFYVYSYEIDPNACFGFGVGHVIRFDQHGANIALSSALLNAMMAAGITGAVVKGALESPNGEQLSLIKPQMFQLNDSRIGEGGIDAAISFKTVPVTIGPILELYDRLKQNADQHSLMPVMGPGDSKRSVTAASGIAMLLNNDNIVQRAAANQWDDEVTIPLLSALITFMKESGLAAQHGALGDFDVVPKASGHLLVKDKRLQHNMLLIQMAQNDPDAAIIIDKEKLIRQVVMDTDADADNVLRTPEAAQALREQQQPPPDPEQIKAETERYKCDKDAEVRLQEAEAMITKESIQSRTAIAVAQLNYRAAMMKLASDEKVKMADVAKEMRLSELDAEVSKMQAAIDADAKSRIAQIRSADDRFKIGAKTEIEAQKIADQKLNRQVQLATEKPVRLAG